MSDAPTFDGEFDFETGEGGLSFEADPFQISREFQPQLLSTTSRIAIIRTSDRNTYRRCRRKWNLQHSSRGNLRSAEESGPFWLGSGFHFAMEDFHGYHHFQHPREALQAYATATQKTDLILPSDLDELLDLGQHMCDYYESWLETREPLNTLWINGEPQVEVNFHIEIPKEHLEPFCPRAVLDLYDKILYSMTLDRVTKDSYNRLWMQEYKSAKNFQWYHLDTDGQVSAYNWGLTVKYPGYEIAGTIYQQFKKQIIQPPAFLSSTKMFSISKRQKTSYALYMSALRNLYGTNPQRFPEPNRMFLEYLQEQETQDSDDLIKRDYIERNATQIKNEYKKILMETSEMINPDTLLYPNPTRDCSWDCPFNAACIGIDSGENWTQELTANTIQRDTPNINWRNHLILPQQHNDNQKVY